MPAHDRRTKIVATIGPASASEEVLFRLIESGMDAARLNFSHGTHDDHRESARLVREAQTALSRPLALVADLQGPKVRIGDLPQPVALERGEEVVVAGADSARGDDLPVAPAVLTSVLEPIMIVVVGVVIGGMVVDMYLPMFDVIKRVQH